MLLGGKRTLGHCRLVASLLSWRLTGFLFHQLGKFTHTHTHPFPFSPPHDSPALRNRIVVIRKFYYIIIFVKLPVLNLTGVEEAAKEREKERKRERERGGGESE